MEKNEYPRSSAAKFILLGKTTYWMHGDPRHAGNAKTRCRSAGQKQEKLFAILGSYSRVMVAYSGGTDSAYLAWPHKACWETMRSPLPRIPPRFPNRISGMPRPSRVSVEYSTSTLKHTNFDQPRLMSRTIRIDAFIARTNFFTQLDALAQPVYRAIIYGVNVDDLGDYRPGQKAAKLIR